MNPTLELLCELDPMASASTPPAIMTWVAECAARFEHMQHRVGHELRAGVWPYRRQGNQIYIACDIGTASDDVEGMSFAIGGPHDFDLYNPVVPDAAEALHMIGLLCRRLGAKVVIGQQALHTTPTSTPEGLATHGLARARRAQVWCEHAYPLQQITIKLQGTRHSDRAEIVGQLDEVVARLKAGDVTGESSDDDFGYLFEVNGTSAGPSVFSEPASYLRKGKQP